MNRYFVFRVNYDDAHEWLMEELFSHGRLRQGWGKNEFQLIDAGGVCIEKSVWSEKYRKVWQDSDDEIWKRHDILSRMLEISEGDLLVIPKTGGSDTLTICEASGSYLFDYNGRTMWDDFKHIVPIRNPRSYRYTSCTEANIISSKFKAYQSAVNNVWQNKTIEAIKSLYKLEPSNLSKSIKQITNDIIEHALRPIADTLLDIDPNQFEDIIAECLRSRGYEILGMRKYDGQGADVDIVASYSLPYFSEVIDQAPILLFQIKKKRGRKDSDDVEGIKQLVASEKNYVNPVKILINTVEEISQDASELAATHDVKIVDGLQIINFILKSEIKPKIFQP